MKIGLALSGGGIRGVAHIGVIRAMEEEGIAPDILAGTSAGSIIGALYASGMDSKDMFEFVQQSNLYKTISFSWPVVGFASLDYLKDRLAIAIKDSDFSNLNIPLYITRTNINIGKLEVVHEGDNLFECVAASCAIPMIFEPVKINNNLYIDGGVLKNLPASIIEDKCELLIGVNLMPKLIASDDKLKSMITIAARTFEMSIWRNQQDDIPLCDLHIEIKGLRKFNIFNFNKFKEIYEIGYSYGKSKMPELLELIDSFESLKKQH
jgi:NTE family protein